MWRNWNHRAPLADKQNGEAALESSLAVPQKATRRGASLAVQQLRLRGSTAGGTGSIPGWGTKIPQAAHRPKKKTTLKSPLK